MSIRKYFENIADAIKTKGGTSTALTPAEMPRAILDLPTGSSTADGVTYDNTASGLTANNVQDAIDELAEGVSTIHSDISELKPSALPTSYTTRTSTSNQVDHFHGCSFNVVIPAFMQSSRCTLTLTQANGITDSAATDIKSNVYFRDNNDWVQTTINGLSFAENGSRCLLANNTVCGAVELTFSVSWS